MIRRLSEEKNYKRIPYVKLIIARKGSDDVRWVVIRLKVYIATWQTLAVAGDIEVDCYEQGVK